MPYVFIPTKLVERLKPGVQDAKGTWNSFPITGKNISKILQAEKWQPFFRALQKKTDKESNSMTWMAKSRFTGYPKYTTLPTSSPHHRITKFLQKHYWFVRQLYSCGTGYSQKDRFASRMFFTVQIPDNSTARFPDQCHFISPKHDRYHPGCNFSDPDQKNLSISCLFITTATDSRSNKA